MHTCGRVHDCEAVDDMLAATPKPMLRVLGAVRLERAAQDGKWGEQNHPDGIGDGATLFGIGFDRWAHVLREAVDRHAREHRTAWALILLEEVFEALAEDDPVKVRAELVQVAAIAAAWVEAIDRRQAREVTT